MVDLNTLIWAIINFLVLLSIPIAIIIVFVKFHRRLNRIEEEISRIAAKVEKERN